MKVVDFSKRRQMAMEMRLEAAAKKIADLQHQVAMKDDHLRFACGKMGVNQRNHTIDWTRDGNTLVRQVKSPAHEALQKILIDTEDPRIRRALIEMGWTPPGAWSDEQHSSNSHVSDRVAGIRARELGLH